MARGARFGVNNFRFLRGRSSFLLGLVPVVDLVIAWLGGTSPGLEKRFWAHQKRHHDHRPFRIRHRGESDVERGDLLSPRAV